MTITIQSQVPVILGITVFILIFLKFINIKLQKRDPLDKQSGIVLLSIWLVEMIDGWVDDMVSPKYTKEMAPYIGSIAIYILLSNYIGLLGFDNPTGNYSVTLTLAIITWIMIQVTDIKYSGVKAYIHSFFEPIFLFVVPNFFGTVAPMVSMSLRIFGNILAGTIIMQLVYSFASIVSNAILSIFSSSLSFNFLGPIIAAPLHCYFDLFSGLIQMYIFVMLTMVFVGNKIPEEQK